MVVNIQLRITKSVDELCTIYWHCCCSVWAVTMCRGWLRRQGRLFLTPDLPPNRIAFDERELSFVQTAIQFNLKD